MDSVSAELALANNPMPWTQLVFFSHGPMVLSFLCQALLCRRKATVCECLDIWKTGNFSPLSRVWVREDTGSKKQGVSLEGQLWVPGSWGKGIHRCSVTCQCSATHWMWPEGPKTCTCTWTDDTHQVLGSCAALKMWLTLYAAHRITAARHFQVGHLSHALFPLHLEVTLP